MTFEHGNDHGRATQFKPGQSGNPAGRPKEYGLVTLLQDAIAEQDQEQGSTIAKQLIDVAITKALKGDFRFFKEILDRLEGKVSDKLELSAAQEYSDQEIKEAALLIAEEKTNEAS